MNKSAIALSIVLVGVLSAFAQETWTTSKIGTYNNYDYELWSQDNKGTTQMKLTGDNGVGAGAKGGTFEVTWQNTINVLFRSGRKFKNNETVSSVGNITVDFEATWSSTDNVKMLGVYGWGYFAAGSIPDGFSDQIEYYIIQDLGSYNSAESGTNCTQKGSAAIDGITYNFAVCDRVNQPMLTGNGTFKQYFSYPASTSNHRQSGLITVSKHFEEWAKVGMTMNKLYEVAMKVESYTGESYTGSSQNANGSATITKNILTIGGSLPSSSSVASSSSTAPAGGLFTTKAQIQADIDANYSQFTQYSAKPTKVIALSFDDGPSAQTQALLDILNTKKVKTTFFVIGQNITNNTAAATAIFNAGHELANHSSDYNDLSGTADAIKTKLQSANTSIRNITGSNPTLFRAPNFTYSTNLTTATTELGLPIIHASVVSQDYDELQTSAQIKTRVLDGATDGGIINMHEFNTSGSRLQPVLSEIIDGLRSAGYWILPVGQMAIYKCATLNAGVQYSTITAGTCSATPSSSSTAPSSSSAAKVQATTCTDFVEYGTTPANPYTACFKHTDNKCYVCKILNEEDYTCASNWLWNDTKNVDENLEKGYWYQEVACPDITPIVSQSVLPYTPTISYRIYDLRGKFHSQISNLQSLPQGVWIVKSLHSNGSRVEAQIISNLK
ncbi:hypothetical protein AGMMS49938_00500 [Fibrobacterales bacterium]|nr:hypothetical protein AGMMS49938_00500 [Fibrobacterales bacterium]